MLHIQVCNSSSQIKMSDMLSLFRRIVILSTSVKIGNIMSSVRSILRQNLMRSNAM